MNYDEWHEQLNVDQDADAPWHQLVRTHLVPERDLAGRRVLEIGCGRGGFSLWLASRPIRPRHLVSVDFSPTAIRKGRAAARGVGLEGITWEVGDIQAIAHPDDCFDTVISCETIEHVRDPPRAIRELSRVLRPGGRLFLTAPNYLGIYGIYRAYLRLAGRPFTEEGQPINQFTLLPLTRTWVFRAGLKSVIVDGSGHYLLWPGRIPSRIHSFDRLRLLTRWLGLHSLVVAEKRTTC